jgi:hypothetical protein
MMTIKLKLLNRNLSPEEEDAMWAIYHKYYDCEKSYFMSRIAQHHFFILFLNDKEIVGFTGIKRDVVKKGNTKKIILGLAMTVVDEDYRNKALIQRSVAKLYQRELLNNPFHKVFVWSVTASYKPYLVFAKGVRTFYPQAAFDMPEDYKVLKKTICEKYFEDYDLDKNLVYIKGFRVTDSSVLTYEREDGSIDKDVHYYKKLYLSGRPIEGREIKGVLTLAPMNFNNLFYWGTKLIQKKLRKQTKLNLLENSKHRMSS